MTSGESIPDRGSAVTQQPTAKPQAKSGQQLLQGAVWPAPDGRFCPAGIAHPLQ